MAHEFAIGILENEVKSLNSEIEGARKQSDAVRSDDLYSAAQKESFDEAVLQTRQKCQAKIAELEAAMEMFKTKLYNDLKKC